MMPGIHCRQIESDDELAACFAIRNKVFVQEQNLFCSTDQDEHDMSALHFGAFLDSRIIGTVRVYQDDDGTWWGGRLAVLKRYRGRAGRDLVLTAVEQVKQRGAEYFYANIQKKNLHFFTTIGWSRIGEEFMMQGCPHILIEADLT